MKFSSSLLPKVNVPRKLHITILSVLGGLILILSLLYFLSVPSRFQLGAGYVFSPLTTDPDQTIITDGADAIAVGPARIRLWGAYPMVFGFTDRPEQERFLIDLENHEVRFFPAESDGFHQYDDFDAFFGSHPV